MDVKKSRRYTMNSEDEKIFRNFASEMFRESIEIEDFIEILEENPRKLVIDLMMCFIHSRVRKYGSLYISKENLPNKVLNLRNEFPTILGKFESKLDSDEIERYNEYWAEKELIRTLLFLLIFTINNAKRREDELLASKHALEIVTRSTFDKNYGRGIASVFEFITTSGEIHDFYSDIYVADFEFLFGNYIKPLFYVITNKKGGYIDKKDYNRHQKIQEICQFSKKKYDTLFSSMDSSLRNALAHKTFFVNRDDQTIKFENYKNQIETITLQELEEKTLFQRISRYMLITSNEFLAPANNIFIQLIKRYFYIFITEPKKFQKISEEIVELISKRIRKRNVKISQQITKFSHISKELLKYYFSFCLEISGHHIQQGFVSIANRCNYLVIPELSEKQKKRFVKEIETSYRIIKLDDKDLEKKYKDFIKLIFLRFIEDFPRHSEHIKQLYNNL